MKKERTFTITLYNEEKFEIRAHFLTVPGWVNDPIRFWSKPHWYSRRRCVGSFKRCDVKGVASADTSDWLAEIGVRA